jgi:hypothetical protein
MASFDIISFQKKLEKEDLNVQANGNEMASHPRSFGIRFGFTFHHFTIRYKPLSGG